MTKRDIIKAVLDGKKPPYVPWSFWFTGEAGDKLAEHYGTKELDGVLHQHCLGMGNAIGRFEKVGLDRHRDVFGVVWDRSADKDIGIVETLRTCIWAKPMTNDGIFLSGINLESTIASGRQFLPRTLKTTRY